VSLFYLFGFLAAIHIWSENSFLRPTTIRGILHIIKTIGIYSAEIKRDKIAKNKNSSKVKR
jgi:hypothetical protein